MPLLQQRSVTRVIVSTAGGGTAGDKPTVAAPLVILLTPRPAMLR
jgi:hypothetical protein